MFSTHYKSFLYQATDVCSYTVNHVCKVDTVDMMHVYSY